MTPRRRHGARLAGGIGIVLLCPVVALGGISAASVAAIAVGIGRLAPDATASAEAVRDIPVDLLTLYQQSAARCPGLPWPVLAGIGKVESDHNRPAGQVSAAGAEGPMQFLPATWAQYGTDGDGDGRADPFDPADAIGAAADYLCGHNATVDLTTAVASYTCGGLGACLQRAESPDGYATRVLDWAARYSDPTGPSGTAATFALQVALAQVGTPYLWGGETPVAGFDCSGLVQYAYSRAGLPLARTAQSQYDHGPHLPLVTQPQPGDLVFFGDSPAQVSHVGIALGQGRMVDAPHTGALVRVEPIAGFGHYLGATRPAAGLSS